MKKTSAFDRVIGAAAYLAGILLAGTVLIVCFEICMRLFLQGTPNMDR